MRALHDEAPAACGGPGERIALVMLPGAGDRAADFVERGFIRAVRERNLPVDVIAADAVVDYYLERSVVSRLEQDIVAPARARGYARLWFMGISLGGLGALSYAREHAGEIEAVVLIAPFLGTRGLIAEVRRAGGLRQWHPGPLAADDPERELLEWLRRDRSAVPSLPRLYLGYGTEDRFSPASELLAAQLAPQHVATVRGGHDWDTWLALWRLFLDGGIISKSGASV